MSENRESAALRLARARRGRPSAASLVANLADDLSQLSTESDWVHASPAPSPAPAVGLQRGAVPPGTAPPSLGLTTPRPSYLTAVDTAAPRPASAGGISGGVYGSPAGGLVRTSAPPSQGKNILVRMTKIDSPEEMREMCGALFTTSGDVFCGDERETVDDRTSSTGSHLHPRRCVVKAHLKKAKAMFPTSEECYPLFLLPASVHGRRKEAKNFYVREFITAERIPPDMLSTFETASMYLDGWIAYMAEANRVYEQEDPEEEEEYEGEDARNVEARLGRSSSLGEIAEEDSSGAYFEGAGGLVFFAPTPYVGRDTAEVLELEYSTPVTPTAAPAAMAASTRDVVDALRENVVAVADSVASHVGRNSDHYHVYLEGLSVGLNKLATKMTSVVDEAQRLKGVTGSYGTLLEANGFDTLSELLSALVNQTGLPVNCDPAASIAAKVETLESLIQVVDEDGQGDLYKVGEALRDQLRAVLRRVATLEGRVTSLPGSVPAPPTPHVAPPVGNDILHNARLLDAAGLPRCSMSEMMDALDALRTEFSAKEARLAKLEADAQKDSAGLAHYSSMADLEADVRAADPKGRNWHLFCCATTIAAHHRSSASVLSANDAAAVKEMTKEAKLGVAQKKHVCLLTSECPAGYTLGGELKELTKLKCFDTLAVWQGAGGCEGARDALGREVGEASQALLAELDRSFPKDSTNAASRRLRAMAIDLVASTKDYCFQERSFLDTEATRQTQRGMPVEATLIFVSSCVKILYKRFHDVFRLAPEWFSGMDMAQYMTELLWYTLQVHKEMTTLTKDGFAADGQINTAMVRYLNQVASGGDSIGSELKAVKKEAAEAAAAATKALSKATSMGTTAKSALDKVDKIINLNRDNSNFKWNTRG